MRLRELPPERCPLPHIAHRHVKRECGYDPPRDFGRPIIHTWVLCRDAECEVCLPDCGQCRSCQAFRVAKRNA
jgi:hypothetical protein